MDVFDLRNKLIGDYSHFVRSFINISDELIRSYVQQQLEDGAIWPEPLIQLNPAFELGETVDDLISSGVLHEECRKIFRSKDAANVQGHPLQLYRHQVEAIKIAAKGRDFVLTTGTGSGKSLAYIIPAVNHVLQNGSGRGIQAIIVYPMNALANSQIIELEKFIDLGYPDKNGPVTFKRYTGQETDEEKNEIVKNPPDILLTNYVMLELILTRPKERGLVRAANGLRFLVLDEFHTYRGRKGADVAMLVRRTREAMGGHRMQCVGTSATLASEGSWDDQKNEVRKAASLLFGSNVLQDDVIGETLQRITSDESVEADEFIGRLRERLHQSPPTDPQSFANDPLAIWIESTVGVRREKSSTRLIRQTPAGIRGARGIASKLAKQTGEDQTQCEGAIQETLNAGFGLCHPVTGLPVFAFRIHQFISRGDTVYASPEPATSRHITLYGQQFVPGDRGRVLLPLAFCRDCGQEYYSVWRMDDQERGGHRFTSRDFNEKTIDEKGEAGYIYISAKNPWPEEGVEKDDFIKRLPEDWIDSAGKVNRDRRKHLPQMLHIQPNGGQGDGGTQSWFVSAPFRFCLECGVSYGFRQQSDFHKLSALGSEGRSTATTILSLSAIRHLEEFPIPNTAKKLLSFTDNRQDASLQAGHFNDFVEVGLIRSALYRAAKASGSSGGLTHDQLAQGVYKALDLPFGEYAQSADLRGNVRDQTNRVFRDVLGYRLYKDLKRGWRVMAPNLEQVGLLKIEYPNLHEACCDTEIWASCHPALAQASPDERVEVATVLLDFMRRELAIRAEYLTSSSQESLLLRSRQRLQTHWGFDESEKAEDMVYATILYPRSKRGKEFGGNIFLSARSGYGQYLRRSSIAHRNILDMNDTTDIIKQLLDNLRKHGLVELAGEPSDVDGDVPGYQINAASMVWVAGDGKAGYHDPIRRPTQSEMGAQANEFFVEYYSSAAQKTRGIQAREHTAQVSYAEREIREKDFREAKLRILFCSPTMELGIDISQLNVVNMRNVPPTPANYAQRSGRAGRSGQPALVFTYCSAGSPHDQYFFKRPEMMVSGEVLPPRVDFTNEDLVRAHVHAVWLAETGLDLQNSLKDLLDINGDKPTMNLLGSVRDTVFTEQTKQKAEKRAKAVLESIREQLNESDWYTEDWLHGVISNAPNSFDQACERWRGLYRSAFYQAKKQSSAILEAWRTESDRKHAELLRKNAEAQLKLLTESRNHAQSDFSPYRYFASEGFLPGYNFPRLPITAYVPGRSPRAAKNEFLSRPRFLAISEFGPQSVIYHEGSCYIINQAILPLRDTENLDTSEAKVCHKCGYLHLDTGSQPRDLCEHCETQLGASIYNLFRLENVVTKRRSRINCDEEERIRLGYNLKTAVRFAERNGQPSYNVARAKVDTQVIASLYFGNAATLWRINLGWLRRKDGGQQGFALDTENGYWGQNTTDETTNTDPMSPQRRQVIPFVEDNKNCLLIDFTGKLDDGEMATLQAAIKNAIQILYQLEGNELVAEPLPDRLNRKTILLYESAEGGAGVLRRIVDNPSALPEIARKALELCHFNPDSGEDLHHAQNAKEDCEAACYDCLMSYSNQWDHGLLDRQRIKDILMALAKSHVEASSTTQQREVSLQGLINLTDSKLERSWLELIEDGNHRLPSHAQTIVRECRTKPDFLYKDHQTAIYVDGPHHEYPDRRIRDEQQTTCMEDAGWTVIRFGLADNWEKILEKNSNIFGKKS